MPSFLLFSCLSWVSAMRLMRAKFAGALSLRTWQSSSLKRTSNDRHQKGCANNLAKDEYSSHAAWGNLSGHRRGSLRSPSGVVISAPRIPRGSSVGRASDDSAELFQFVPCCRLRHCDLVGEFRRPNGRWATSDSGVAQLIHKRLHSTYQWWQRVLRHIPNRADVNGGIANDFKLALYCRLRHLIGCKCSCFHSGRE